MYTMKCFKILYNFQMNILGIRFAPLNVPLERRLQTIAAAIWMMVFMFGALLWPLLTLYLLVYTKFRWLTLLYLFWIWAIDKDINEKGGRPFQWVRSWSIWRYYRNYFPGKLEKVAGVELDPKKNYLFCGFPHGIICSGTFNSFTSKCEEYDELFPCHTPHVATLSFMYHVPFVRDLAMALNGIGSSAKAIACVLGNPGGGHICVLMVGGAEEAFLCKPGSYRVNLRNRKGFVKLALKNGAPLVPMLLFGETDLFDQLEGLVLRKVQEGIKRLLKIAPVVLVGRGFFQYSFGIIPRRSAVTTVVGYPVDVPKIENPSREEVDRYHTKFVEKLTEMFEKEKYNYLEKPEDKFLIVE